MSEYFGKEIHKLGFGLMRLPRIGEEIDVEQTSKMVDLFLEAGGTYFDTAFVYGGSEEATAKALVSRHDRASYTLATKLHAGVVPNAEEAKKEFYTSLERTGAGYFDYYLLHAFMDNNYRKYDEFGLWDYVHELKAEGKVRYIGFSFHSGPELLDQILTEHPEVDFVQLQINYADWEDPGVCSRANYEVARRHGKSIVIMEPVKGGALADPPEKVKKLFRDYAPDRSCASWAIRFAASLDGVITVLSGMSNLEQMEDNLSYMRDFRPLSEEEMEIIGKAQQILAGSDKIPCTACRYCVDGCPKQIPIPQIFAAMNKQIEGDKEEAAKDYAAAAGEGHRASDCIACRKCEKACPQHIGIVEEMKRCTEMMEK